MENALYFDMVVHHISSYIEHSTSYIVRKRFFPSKSIATQKNKILNMKLTWLVYIDNLEIPKQG